MEVEADVDEVLGECLKEWFVGGGVSGAVVIDGFDETASEVVGPDAVGNGASEPGILGCGGPVRELASEVGGGLQCEGWASEWRGWDIDSGAGVFERCGSSGDDFKSAAGVGFAFDTGEGAGEAEVVFLVPAFEGVVVALGAFNADAEEELADGSGEFFGGILNLVEGGRGLCEGGALCSDDGICELVEWDISLELLADPSRHGDRAFRSDGVFIDLEEVGPALGPEVGVFGALEEMVDELSAFIGIGVGEEFACGGGGGESAGDIEAGAAQEGGIVGWWGRIDAELLEFVPDEFVDEVSFGWSVEFAGVARSCDAADGDMSGVADEDGGFTGDVGGGDESFAVDGCDAILIGLVFGFCGDGAESTVVEFGEDAELSGVLCGHGDGGWFDDEFCYGISGFRVEHHAFVHPAEEEFVPAAADGDFESAAVGHIGGGFAEEEAVCGGGGEHAATSAFGDDGGVIGSGVIAEDAEFEAILAFGFAVAAAGVAAGASEQREDIVSEGDGWRGGCVGNRDGGLSREAAGFGGELQLAVAEWFEATGWGDCSERRV